MQWKHETWLFLTVFLFLSLFHSAYGLEWIIPDDLTISIVDGMTWHFGDQSIGTTGTDIHISTWFVSDWVTYTVDSSGTQQIYYSSKPSLVFVDEVEKSEGDQWSYSDGTTTITDATSQVSLFYGTSTPPSTEPPDTNATNGQPSLSPEEEIVFFKVTVGDSPAEGCVIAVFELPFRYYKGRCFTDTQGFADIRLEYGEYQYDAEYEGVMLSGTFWHFEQQIIEINFGEEIGVKPRLPIRTAFISVVVAVVVVMAAVLAINKVRKF